MYYFRQVGWGLRLTVGAVLLKGFRGIAVGFLPDLVSPEKVVGPSGAAARALNRNWVPSQAQVTVQVLFSAAVRAALIQNTLRQSRRYFLTARNLATLAIFTCKPLFRQGRLFEPAIEVRC